jgi:hypothetical protein
MPYTAHEINDQRDYNLMAIMALPEESKTLRMIGTQERMTIFYKSFHKYFDIMINLKTLAFGEYIFEDDEIEFIKDCTVHWCRNRIKELEEQRNIDNFDDTYDDIKKLEKLIKIITKHANCMYNNKHQRFKNWFNLIEATSPRYFMEC